MNAVQKLALKDFEQICLENKFCVREILSHRRERRLVNQRCIIATTLRNKLYSFPIIGYVMNRDHTSICHLVNKYKIKEVI